MSERLVVLGAAESGVGAAILGIKSGYDVFVSDNGSIGEIYEKELIREGINYEQGGHSFDQILNADLVVKSPGVPDSVKIVQELKMLEIPVISEIEFAGRYSDARMVCITGSNGKTTTTSWIYDLFKRAGLNVGIAGNIGKSLARQVACDKHDYYVVELSSFQLDGMYNFKPDIAILLNITPDHLDRYEYKFENYIASKFRIVQNMDKDDALIYCLDDKIVRKELEKIELLSRLLPFSIKETVEEGACVSDGNIKIKVSDNTLVMHESDLALKGRHNTYNSMAAGISAMLMDIKKDTIKASLTEFCGVEHRLEWVAAVRGIDFYNDSKATNVNSTWYALESMIKKTVWIAGGTDKGNDYSDLLELVSKKVKALVCIGVDNEKLKSVFGNLVPEIIEVATMEEAVQKSYQLADKDDCVLLSPACASFDRFKNYEERGDMFKVSVKAL